MYRRARVRRAVAGGAVVVMLALGGCGDSDKAAPATTTAPASSGATTTAPPTTDTPATTSTALPTTSAAAPTTSAHDGPVIQLAVGDEVSRHTVSAGDNVLLVVTGDTNDEVHVHGYDLLAELRPGQPATITFVAGIPGVFEIELEGAHQLLAELEVQ